MEDDTSRVGQWVMLNCVSKSSKKSYKTVLRRWAELIYDAKFGNKEKFTMAVLSEYIDRYVDDPDRIYLDDVKRFIMYCRENYAPNTTRNYVSLVTSFFAAQRENKEDKKFILDEIDKKAIKRLTPAEAPALEDEILTKEQMISVLEHCPISTKAIALFVSTGGVRSGEALKIRMKDVHFDTDPPSVYMRAEYLKKGIGVRTVNCTYEARDATLEWHKARKGRRKKVRKQYSYETKEMYDKRSLFDEDLLFGITNLSDVGDSWNRALRKAGLDKTDSTKKKERFIHHMHTLRSFFKTKLTAAKVQYEVIEAWMGHKRYLGTYMDFTKEEMGEMYKDAMGALSLYGMEKYDTGNTKVISEAEIEEYIDKGWDYKDTLPRDRVVMVRSRRW